MKVIVAGLPKTGTKSMNIALRKLGYNVIYDGPEHMYLLREEYAKIYRDGWTVADFKRMYNDADVVLDMPACNFWEEIHRAFPEAKIILTVRDDEDRWADSFMNQMVVANSHPVLKVLGLLSPSSRSMARDVAEPTFAMHYGWTTSRSWRLHFNEAMLKLKYRTHNAYVKQNAPKDKLLVYSCSDGWDPLCKFLGVPVPDEPFPRKDIRGNIMEELMKSHPMFQNMKREALMRLVCIAVASCFGGYALYKCGPAKICRSAEHLFGK